MVGKFLNGKMKASVYGKAKSLFPFPDGNSMALDFALRHLCGGFLYERNDGLGESRGQKLILFWVGLLTGCLRDS